jgi:hypothetical protein
MSDPAFLKSLGDRLMSFGGFAMSAVGTLFIAFFVFMAGIIVTAIIGGIWALGLVGQIIVGVILFFALAIGCGILGEFLTEKFKE